MKSTCLGCLAVAWLTWLVLPSVACVADEPAGRAAAEPDYRLATAWWGELPRKWTPVGWKNHLFRYNVLFNGAIAAQPDLNRRTTPWAGQGMLLWPSAADPADYAAFPQGWTPTTMPRCCGPSGDCPDFRARTRSVGPKMGLSPLVDPRPRGRGSAKNYSPTSRARRT